MGVCEYAVPEILSERDASLLICPNSKPASSSPVIVQQLATISNISFTNRVGVVIRVLLHSMEEYGERHAQQREKP